MTIADGPRNVPRRRRASWFGKDTVVSMRKRASSPCFASRPGHDPAGARPGIRIAGGQWRHPALPCELMRAVDLFARHPIDFDALWCRADVIDLNGVGVRVASIDDLIAMKRDAGRPLDLDDVGHLERIRARRSKNPSQ